MTQPHYPPTAAPAPWRESFLGGSPQAEAALFRTLAEQMRAVQMRNQQASGQSRPGRTLHAQMLAGMVGARLEVNPQLAPGLAQAHFQPGAVLACDLRLSFASGLAHGGLQRDMRGAALRLHLPQGGAHEILLTNFPVSHARDARQFVEIATLMTGPKALMPLKMLLRLGPGETLRVLRNLSAATGGLRGLAEENFWSRGALLWSEAGPVRLKLHPAAAVGGVPAEGESVAAHFARLLASQDLAWHLSAQRYQDETRTPIEDGCTGWSDADVPWERVATLTVPRQDLGTPTASAQAQALDATPFNPWHAPQAFRPLGNLNRVRRDIYAASAQRWAGRDGGGGGGGRDGAAGAPPHSAR
ncbi:hypothetical protein [Acidovorax sp. NB1]|uniref:hypothetical protein n=1 Tax=Acidovorax sp. NB1 TaxID=1943571 RepID=UPI0010F680FC|nr:hypothetical protein [Acidovorax sp. NB1]